MAFWSKNKSEGSKELDVVSSANSKELETRDALSLAPDYTEGRNNLFGSIAKQLATLGDGYSFIPIDGSGGIQDLTGNIDAQWLGLETRPMQYWAYVYCSPLGGVIDRIAEADTNGRICLVDEKGVPKKRRTPQENRILSLLEQPNPLQTWEEFNSQQVVLCKIFGFCPVFCISPAGMDKSWTKYMWNLNPYYCQPQFNYEFDMYDPLKSNPIKEWRITIFSKSYTIPADDILLVKDGYIDSQIANMGLPTSKVAGLDYFVSNICAAMEADNVLLKKKGPLGVFSHDPKPDMAGWVPLKENEKKELQGELARYGLSWGQLQYVISKTPLKWNPMSFKVSELMTKESVRQGIDGICDRFGYPAELMSGKNATYENRSSAEKFLYQNNIIPFSLRRMARYKKFFGIDGILSMDYNHLPVLQEDIMKAGQARNYRSQSLLIDWQAGMITWNEYRVLSELEPQEGMDINIHEYNKKFGINEQVTTPPKNPPVAK